VGWRLDFSGGGTSRGEPEGQTKPVAASQPSPTPAAQNPEVAAVGPYRILLNDVLLLCDEREKTAHPVAEATPVSVIRKKIRKNYPGPDDRTPPAGAGSTGASRVG
jgi:hypothetical protein